MRNRGFVLAEILVVSVIVAILAAVAIPIYTGYITSQRQSVVKNLAQTAAVAANVYYRRSGEDPTPTSQLNIFLPDSSKFTIVPSGRYMVVTDVSLPLADRVKDSAAFR